MIISRDFKIINIYMARHSYVNFMDDPNDDRNDEFLKRIHKVDINFPGFFCFHIKKEEYDIYEFKKIQMKYLEICVIQYNNKIMFDIFPDEEKINFLYIYCQNFQINSDKPN